MTIDPAASPPRRGFSRLIKGLLVLLILWLAGFGAFIYYIATIVPPPASVKTDAIVVLTGGVNRINDGLTMLQQGLAGKLLISGVGTGVTQSSLLLHWNAGGKPIPCCITLGRMAHNTNQNATEARDWAEKENVRTLRLVTAPYHMPRAAVEFHAALPNAEILLCPATPASSGYEKEKFLPLAFLEYNKTLLTWLRLYLAPEIEK